jgi:hypothetical protein
MPKPTHRPIHRKANTPKKFVRVAARLPPAQAAALEREARRRIGERGRGRIDVSEVIREAVSVWMAIRPVQRGIIQDVAVRHDLTLPEVLRKALDVWLTSLNTGEE